MIIVFNTKIMVKALPNPISNNFIKIFETKDMLNSYIKNYALANKVDISLVSCDFTEIDKEHYQEIKEHITDSLLKKQYSLDDVIYLILSHNENYKTQYQLKKESQYGHNS